AIHSRREAHGRRTPFHGKSLPSVVTPTWARRLDGPAETRGKRPPSLGGGGPRRHGLCRIYRHCVVTTTRPRRLDGVPDTASWKTSAKRGWRWTTKTWSLLELPTLDSWKTSASETAESRNTSATGSGRDAHGRGPPHGRLVGDRFAPTVQGRRMATS